MSEAIPAIQDNAVVNLWKNIDKSSLVPFFFSTWFFVLGYSATIIYMYFTDVNYILLTFTALLLVILFYALLSTRKSYKQFIITPQCLPAIEEFDAIALIAIQKAAINERLQKLYAARIKKANQFIIITGLFVILISIGYVVMDSVDMIISGIVIAIASADIFILVYFAVIINKHHISINNEEYEKMKEQYLRLRSISIEEWNKHKDDIIATESNNLEEFKLTQMFQGTMYAKKKKKIKYKDIKKYIQTFPTSKIMEKALEIGYHNYDSYENGLRTGAPNALEHDKMKERGFSDYSTYQKAIECNYPDHTTYQKGITSNCKNYEQYKEMIGAGFEDYQYAQYLEIKAKGFHTYQEYKKALDSGFTDYQIWSIAKRHRIPTYADLIQMEKFGIIIDVDDEDEDPLYPIFQIAINSEFPNYAEFLNAKSNGFDTYEEYIDIQKKGFLTKNEFEKAKRLGFETQTQQKEIMNLGFKDYYQYKEAQKRGCATFNDFELILQNGFQTWKDYITAKQKNFSNPSEFYAAQKLHAPTIEVYHLIIQQGFKDYEEYIEANAKGFLTKDHYDEAQKRNIPNATIMDKMEEGDFIIYEDYVRAAEMGFYQSADYIKALAVGAANAEIYYDLTRKGYPNFELYKTAEEGIFPDYETYKQAVKVHAKNYKEYTFLKNEKLIRSSFIEKTEKTFFEINEMVTTFEESYIQMHDFFDKRSKDYFVLRSSVNVMENIIKQIYTIKLQLDENITIFAELKPKFSELENRIVELESLTRAEHKKLLLEFSPLEAFMSISSKQTIPTLFAADEVANELNMDTNDLYNLLEKYFPEQIECVPLKNSILVTAWIGSPEQKDEFKKKLREFLIGLENGKTIGVSKIRELISYPGNEKQFADMLDSVINAGEAIGTINQTDGVFIAPKADYFAENFTQKALRENIEHEVLEINTSRLAKPIVVISQKLGSPDITPTFLKVLQEVLDKHTLIEYDTETGLISPPILDNTPPCPICKQTIKIGQKVGICPHCNTKTHYNELLHYVLNKYKCPQCQQHLIVDQITEEFV